MKKSLETILDGIKHCKRVKCLDCPYEKIETISCNYTLLVDCAEMLRFQSDIIKDMEDEQTRLINEITAYKKVIDCFKDETDETF